MQEMENNSEDDAALHSMLKMYGYDNDETGTPSSVFQAVFKSNADRILEEEQKRRSVCINYAKVWEIIRKKCLENF